MSKVALVGHSQIPTQMPDLPGIEVKIFRWCGAKLEHMYERPLRDVFNYKPDLCILYIGGNDLATADADRTEVMRKLREVLIELKQVTKDLRWVTLEEQFYPSRNRFGVNCATYSADCRWLNNNIRRFLHHHQIGMLNVTGPWWRGNQTDGIHFNNQAQNSIVHKFVTVIVYVIHQIRGIPNGTPAHRPTETHISSVANRGRRRSSCRRSRQ